VPEYWVVDVVGETVEIHSGPANGGYTRVERVGRNGVVRPLAFPTVELSIDEMFQRDAG
jgi:Uma2 family endonuclease